MIAVRAEWTGREPALPFAVQGSGGPPGGGGRGDTDGDVVADVDEDDADADADDGTDFDGTNFARNAVASSTVTFSVPLPAVAVRPMATPSLGRSAIKVSCKPTVSEMSPTRKRAVSIKCAFKSPCEPEPAASLRSRQFIGNFGSAIQSWRYVPRKWRIWPSWPESIICLA